MRPTMLSRLVVALKAVISWYCILQLLSPNAFPQKVLTAAGGYIGDGGPATLASFGTVDSVAYDAKGNLYIADWGANRIRKVNTKGVITTIAGNGIAGYSGDGGPAKSATLFGPRGIVVDAGGNVIFSDTFNARIRRIDPSGTIMTIAGNGTCAYSGDGGPAVSAALCGPTGLAVDSSRSVYFADESNNVIRKVDNAGIITTVAGTGVAGFSGDGGTATSAKLNNPSAVVLDGSGNLYINDDRNHRVRLVSIAGIITTLAGSGASGCSGLGGPATSAKINPRGLVLGAGMLAMSCGGDEVLSVDLGSNVINAVAGNDFGFNGDGNAALSTAFNNPRGLAYDRSGSLVIVDSGNDRIRRVDSVTAIVSTIAGGYVGDGGKGTAGSLSAFFGFESGISFDAGDNLYIADFWNNRVRKLSVSGTITTFAGTGMVPVNSGDGGPATAANLGFPTAVVSDSSGNVFIADLYRIRKVDGTGTINNFEHLAPYGCNDCPSTIASMTIGPSGNIYAADADYSVVWKITPQAEATILAGVQGSFGFNGDGIPSNQASLYLDIDSGVAVDSQENVYISDTWNNRVRKVDSGTGLISTVAGNGDCGLSGDGGPAVNAMLCTPEGIAVDGGGSLYIADNYNLLVRKVSSGTINSIAGTGNLGYNGNGLLSTQTNMDPLLLAVNSVGRVYEAETLGSLVRSVDSALLLSPLKVDFSTLAVGKTAQKTLRIVNKSNAVVNLGSMIITGTNSADFSFSSSCGATLSVGGSCSISVRFRPGTLGPKFASLSIASDALGSPYVAGLTGTAALGTPACGAYDVSALVHVARGPITHIPFSNLYSETITGTNISNTPIPVPVSVVMDSLATQTGDPIVLEGSQLTTTCGTPNGSLSYLLPLQFTGNNLQPGETGAYQVIFVTNGHGIGYKTRVFSGFPNQ